MNSNAMKLLEFDKIKAQLKEYAVSELGKEHIEKLNPSIDISIIEGWMKQTTEARAIVDKSSSIPLNSLQGIDKVMTKLGMGNILQPEELTVILGLLKAGTRVKRFMQDKSSIAPMVSSYALSMFELEDLALEIDRCICNDRVDDRASTELARVRKKIIIAEDRIASKLESLLRSNAFKEYVQDGVVSVRNGRYVIPIKREHKRNVEGSVLDMSTSGSTVFIEPAAVKKLQDELNILKLEEEKEVYRILSTLTAEVEVNCREININIEAMAFYDFLFAKAKFSRFLEARSVKFNSRGYVLIKGGKHPLIGKNAIPLEFSIGEKYRSLLITGPNTGGKTVALKTVGLLTMMAQAGLHVPVDEGSELNVFRDILVDIGDGQSIEQSLSTFSSHIRNIASILECTDPYTLVIIDELGTGTDPGEGMGLAVAVLEEIYKKGSTTLATTHYSEIKEFAEKNEGYENGCMEFDIETLKPLYRLKIGATGESNAFLIALRLGMNKKIIERAHEVTYGERKEYKDYSASSEIQSIKNIEIIGAHIKQKERAENLKDTRQILEKQNINSSYKLGDCVYISTMDRTGIVCELENNKGEIGIMVMKTRIKVNKKRISLYIDGKEMYPEGYDYDIVLESKENRKKKHTMDRKHVAGLVIERGER